MLSAQQAALLSHTVLTLTLRCAGTIFGVWERSSPETEDPTVADILRPGAEMVCAGYALSLCSELPFSWHPFGIDMRVARSVGFQWGGGFKCSRVTASGVASVSRYCMYGSATELVLTGKSDTTFGTGVHRSAP